MLGGCWRLCKTWHDLDALARPMQASYRPLMGSRGKWAAEAARAFWGVWAGGALLADRKSGEWAPGPRLGRWRRRWPLSWDQRAVSCAPGRARDFREARHCAGLSVLYKKERMLMRMRYSVLKRDGKRRDGFIAKRAKRDVEKSRPTVCG